MNKIVGLAYQVVEVPMKYTFKVSLGEISAITSVIVKVETENGIYGLGEAAPVPFVTGETIATVKAALELFRPLLCGMEANDISGVHAVMDRALKHNTAAKCAVDIALYDIKGKIMQAPLYQVLGGNKPTVVNDLTIGIDRPEKMAEKAKQAVQAGFSIIKVKTGLNPADDVKAIALIRKAVGPDVVIRIDANQGYDLATAVDTLNRMKPYQVAAAEQCLPEWDFAGAAELKQKVSGISLMLDESIHSPHDAMRAAKLRAADTFNIKLMKCGGLYNAEKINTIAEVNDINCMVGCMPETKIGITAGLSFVAAHANVTESDCDSFLLTKDPEMGMPGGFTRKGGVITLTDKPGLGIAYDF
ncbi:mandelate racemase/muconate lactonizing enzyme family protein [Lactobacillus corticis]|uniref:Dipeptide epimerase n=1 Tax=Lactobacillus corticis TaxID=2201249 RepID=A0A916QKG4_9LACO|nr:dipeptide epimerase [Lactobacillus corticis]GFZ27543.1 L-alanine-DL-glutamate epimerase [Lactobacillus corticis]